MRRSPSQENRIVWKMYGVFSIVVPRDGMVSQHSQRTDMYLLKPRRKKALVASGMHFPHDG